MKQDEVLTQFREAGALLEGHFILTSGLHSPVYLQCARVMMDTTRASVLCAALVKKLYFELGEIEVDWIVSPALGGVIVGYEVGRHMAVPAIFAERVEGRFVLRRGFSIAPNESVIMVEDVVTTGKSSQECINCVHASGGKVIAAACLIDRSGGAADLDVPLVALANLSVPAYPADQVPMNLTKIPAVKPGSRGLV